MRYSIMYIGLVLSAWGPGGLELGEDLKSLSKMMCNRFCVAANAQFQCYLGETSPQL